MARRKNTATDLGLLALRATVGGLMAGHGAQKLFGSFGGHGLKGTAGWLESLGLTPGDRWAVVAGGSEFGSGLLIALGFLNPLGPIGLFGPMLTAWQKAHTGKPVWVTSGGPELVIMYMAAATTLAFTGPGNYSVDAALDIEVPAVLTGLAVAGVITGFAYSALQTPPPPAEANEAGGELQAGTEAGDNGVDTALGR